MGGGAGEGPEHVACGSQALVSARKGGASAEGCGGHLPWCYLRTCWQWVSLAREIPGGDPGCASQVAKSKLLTSIPKLLGVSQELANNPHTLHVLM